MIGQSYPLQPIKFPGQIVRRISWEKLISCCECNKLEAVEEVSADPLMLPGPWTAPKFQGKICPPRDLVDSFKSYVLLMGETG